jgi:hypothetical protein
MFRLKPSVGEIVVVGAGGAVVGEGCDVDLPLLHAEAINTPRHAIAMALVLMVGIVGRSRACRANAGILRECAAMNGAARQLSSS